MLSSTMFCVADLANMATISRCAYAQILVLVDHATICSELSLDIGSIRACDSERNFSLTWCQVCFEENHMERVVDDGCDS